MTDATHHFPLTNVASSVTNLESSDTLEPLKNPTCKISYGERKFALKLLFDEYFRIAHEQHRNDEKIIAQRAALQEEYRICGICHTLPVYKSAFKSKVISLKRTDVQTPLFENLCTVSSTENPIKINKITAKPSVSLHSGLKLVHSAEELSKWGYPMEIPCPNPSIHKTLLGTQRICARCNSLFEISEEVVNSKCTHHWGRLVRAQGAHGSGEKMLYACCDAPKGEPGCCTSSHVFEVNDYSTLESLHSFVKLNSPEEGQKFLPFVALDCEMSYTLNGPQLTRITILNWEGVVILDEFVKPDSRVLDYNTRWSGITKENLKDAQTDLDGLLKKFEEMGILSSTVMAGHGLDNDLKALRIIHSNIIDTSILYLHPRGPPFRFKLKQLAFRELGRQIQIGGSTGHDSYEDTRAALELLWKKCAYEITTIHTSASKKN